MSTEAPPEQDGDRRPEPRMVQRLRERRETHRDRGAIYRGAFVLAGFVVLAAGLAMLVLPGPALLVIPVGLAILSLEFAWAARALDEVLDRAAKAQEKASGLGGRQMVVLIVIAVVCAMGAVAAYVVYRTS